MISSTSMQTHGQFLPSLQPSSSSTTQPISRTQNQNHHFKDNNKMLDPVVKNTTFHSSLLLHNNTAQSKSDHHLCNQQHISKLTTEDEAAAERITAATATQKSSSPPAIDKKKDKKSQARKYLVEGLSTSQYGGNNGRRLFRSNTFNHQQCAAFNQARAQRSLNSRHPRSHDATTRNRDQLHFISGIGHFPQEDTSSKVKKAIENWNELVLELQSEQYRRLNSFDEQFSLDSNSSSDDGVPSPIYKDRHRKPLYAPHSLLPVSNQSSTTHMQSNAKSNPNPFSLSFAKYRPITPGLLFDLDKNKISSRKKTQRWINQLEVKNRSYNGISSRTFNKKSEVEEEEMAAATVPGESNTHASESITVSPISAKPLHRTDSYGSTRTRQSGIPFHNKKQHHGFL